MRGKIKLWRHGVLLLTVVFGYDRNFQDKSLLLPQRPAWQLLPLMLHSYVPIAEITFDPNTKKLVLVTGLVYFLLEPDCVSTRRAAL